MKPLDIEPETSPRLPRNNRLLFRLRNSHSNPIFNPPTQAPFEDSNQNLNTQKGAEKSIEVIPEKTTIGDDGVAAKKREVPFADETAADEIVKSCCLFNKERAMFPFIILSSKISNKEIEDDFLTFERGMPPRNTNRVNSPSTQTSFDDPEQKFDTEKDAENAIEAIPEKSTTDDDNGVAAKKQKVSFAHETAANATVKPWNLRLRNKEPTCSSPQPPMKLGEADEENSDEVKNHMIANFSITVSNKKKEEDFLAFTGNKPSRKPKRRPRNVQKAIDRVTPAFKITEIIDGIIRRSRLLDNHEGTPLMRS